MVTDPETVVVAIVKPGEKVEESEDEEEVEVEVQAAE